MSDAGGSDWGAGRGSDPLDGPGPRPRRVRPEPPRVLGGPDDGAPVRPDPVAVAAVVIGFLGIVVFGILSAIVTAVLASIAGQRAKQAGRSLSTAYLAFGLAAVDGVVWLVLHAVFELAYPVG